MKDNHTLASKIIRMLHSIDYHQNDQQTEHPNEEEQEHQTDLENAAESIAETIHVYFVRESDMSDQEDSIVDAMPSTEHHASDEKPAHLNTIQKPKQQYPLLLLFVVISFSGICLTSLTVWLILPLLTPHAIITIVPEMKAITSQATISLPHAQLFPPITRTQTTTVPTTGKGHQNAIQATGFLTFYNALPTNQTIPAGTMLTSSGGIQITTDDDATIPAGSLQTNGYTTVSAHALNPGPEGNIPAGTITGPCCRAYVLATNLSMFGGGMNAQDFSVVTAADIQTASTSLQQSLIQNIHNTFTTQTTPSDILIAPLSCMQTISSDHDPGEEASQVQVTVQETCNAAAYQPQELQYQEQYTLQKTAQEQLGSHYTVCTSEQSAIKQLLATNGTVGLSIQITGRCWYTFTQYDLEAIKWHIAGKKKQQAYHYLAHIQGGGSIHLTIAGGDSIPSDLASIQVQVMRPPI